MFKGLNKLWIISVSRQLTKIILLTTTVSTTASAAGAAAVVSTAATATTAATAALALRLTIILVALVIGRRLAVLIVRCATRGWGRIRGVWGTASRRWRLAVLVVTLLLVARVFYKKSERRLMNALILNQSMTQGCTRVRLRRLYPPHASNRIARACRVLLTLCNGIVISIPEDKRVLRRKKSVMKSSTSQFSQRAKCKIDFRHGWRAPYRRRCRAVWRAMAAAATPPSLPLMYL